VLTPEQMEALRAVDSPTVANAIEAFGARDRTVGYPSADIRCLFPDLPVTLGYAVTAIADSTVPGAPRGREGLFRLWEAVAAAPKPAVVVVKDVGPEPRRSCHCGDVMANTARALGAIALITDGGVRDLDEVRALGFQFFALGAVVSHGNFGIVDVGMPVTIAGAQICPDDLIHGDANGFVVIPRGTEDRVMDEVRKVREREAEMIRWVSSSDFGLEGLRKRFGL
jgi:4-hydroxy-4-methyl-2-oxoglutarate aldolase